MTPEEKRRRVLQYWHRATMFNCYEVKLVDDTYFDAPAQKGFGHVYLARSDGHELYIGRIKEAFAHEVVGMLRRAIQTFLELPTPVVTADYMKVENQILTGEFDFRPEQAGAVD